MQLASLAGTAIKYVLHTIDLRHENPWENKSMYIFYLELILGAPRAQCGGWPLPTR